MHKYKETINVVCSWIMQPHVADAKGEKWETLLLWLYALAVVPLIRRLCGNH